MNTLDLELGEFGTFVFALSGQALTALAAALLRASISHKIFELV